MVKLAKYAAVKRKNSSSLKTKTTERERHPAFPKREIDKKREKDNASDQSSLKTKTTERERHPARKRRKHLKLETQLCDIPKYTKSDYVGVHGHRGKWSAKIDSLSLGTYQTEDEAARAYDAAVRARDAGKPSNLRAKTNFANEDQNILPELEKQRILTEVEAKRAQMELQKVHARKYIGVFTKNLGSYTAQHHNTHISTYDSAEKAALAHDIFCRSLRLRSRMNDTINEGNTKLSVDEKDKLHKKIEKVKKKREASLKK